MSQFLANALSYLTALVFVFVSFWLGTYYSSPGKSSVMKTSTLEPVFPMLTKMDPIEVGHVREMELIPGQTHKVKTLSIRPALFEVENFLSHDECDEIIRLAMKTGLMEANVYHPNPDSERLRFTTVDSDGDGVLNKTELNAVIKFLRNANSFDEDLEKMVADLELDPDKNGLLTPDEYQSIFSKEKYPTFLKYIDEMPYASVMSKQRENKVTWITERDDEALPMLDKLRERMQRVTGLPRDIIWTSEDLQVAKYNLHGHYHCHMDTVFEKRPTRRPCCHYDLLGGEGLENCVPCRYVTFFYYLKEPEEGGETAFPFADTTDEEYEALSQNANVLCNLTAANCKKAKLAYKPKKGTALFWYNHFFNARTGWIGAGDKRSTHGGCDVTKGVKWSANNWIDVGYDRLKDMQMWALYKRQIRNYDVDFEQ